MCAACSLSVAARVKAHDGAAGSTVLARRLPELKGKREVGRSALPTLIASNHTEARQGELRTS